MNNFTYEASCNICSWSYVAEYLNELMLAVDDHEKQSQYVH